MLLLAASKIIVKSPNGSDFESQLPFFFMRLKNFLENTFVPHSESDTGLLIRIDIKIANTMRDIDRQSEEIKKIWEEEDKPKTIITTTPSEVKGLMDMEISLEESIRSIDDAKDINYDDMAGG